MKRRISLFNYLLCLVILLSSYFLLRQKAESANEEVSPSSLLEKPTSFRSYFLLGKKDFVEDRQVEDGVIHKAEWRKSGPLFFNTVIVNLDKPFLHLEAEKGQDKLFKGEKVASLAEREKRSGKNVIAAINADFWGDKFTPVGLFVDEGTIFKDPVPRHSVFIIDKEGKPHIERVSLEVRLQAGAASLPINTINPLKQEQDAMLFTPRYGEPIKFKSPCVAFKLRQLDSEFIPNQTCRVRMEALAQDVTQTSCDEGMLLLAVKPQISRQYQDALPVSMEAQIMPKLIGFEMPVILALGGIPRLLRDGKISVEWEEETIGESFSTTMHPRTAIGISQDRKKIFLVTVDGRQPAHSIGQSLDDLAKYIKDLGAWDAMNFDGGGSTTIWVRGEITNRPSDATGPRICSNALLVVSSAPVGPPASMDLAPDILRLPTGTKYPLAPHLYDAHFNTLPLNDADIEWQLSGGIGDIKMGILNTTALESNGNITARLKGANLSDTISVELSRPKSINVRPDRVMLNSGGMASLDITATDSKGEYLVTLPDMVHVMPVAGITWDGNRQAIIAEKAGKHILTLDIGGATKDIPVYVDHFKTEVIESFDAMGDIKLTTTNCDEKETNLAMEKENKKEGGACVRVNYKMTSGGTSAVYLTFKKPIPGEPFKLGFWVYGDGKEQWLKGIIKDKDGEEFIADFTAGTRGVYWKNEWQYVDMDTSRMTPKWTNPAAKLDYPLTLYQIYLVQTREAKKSTGTILMDAFSAQYPLD